MTRTRLSMGLRRAKSGTDEFALLDEELRS